MKKKYGIYPAFVVDIKDPENRGRIRCISPEAFDDLETQTGWCEPCTPIGSDFYVPPVDEGVYIMFEEGEVDSPVYLGSWYAEGEPPKGVNFNKVTSKRFISFENVYVLMQKDKVEICVDEGDAEIIVKDGKVTIEGNLIVNGDLKVTGDIIRD